MRELEPRPNSDLGWSFTQVRKLKDIVNVLQVGMFLGGLRMELVFVEERPTVPDFAAS